MEQTRVYQNQPDDQSPPDPNPPVQLDPRPTPKSPPRPKPGVKKKTNQSGSKPDVVGQNMVEEDQRVSTHQGLTNVGLDGNGAIWVSGFTKQPGFLFPAPRPTTPPPPRRQITEEASLSVTPKQVVITTSGLCPTVLDRRLPSHSFTLSSGERRQSARPGPPPSPAGHLLSSCGGRAGHRCLLRRHLQRLWTPNHWIC